MACNYLKLMENSFYVNTLLDYLAIKLQAHTSEFFKKTQIYVTLMQNAGMWLYQGLLAVIESQELFWQKHNFTMVICVVHTPAPAGLVL